MLEPTVILCPLHIVWLLEEVIAAFSVIVTDVVAVQPQESVTVTLCVPADKEDRFCVVAPLFQA